MLMPLFLFRFTQPDRLMLSVRVAANTRRYACDLLGARLGRFLIAAENTHPEPGTILTHFGKIDVPEPKIMSYVDLSGKTIENDR